MPETSVVQKLIRINKMWCDFGFTSICEGKPRYYLNVSHSSGHWHWVNLMLSLVTSANLDVVFSQPFIESVCLSVSPSLLLWSPCSLVDSAWNPSIPLGFVNISLPDVCPEQVKERVLVLNLSSSLFFQNKQQPGRRPSPLNTPSLCNAT